MAIALALIFGGTAVYEAQAYARTRLRPYLAERLRQALGREVELGGVTFWPLGAFSIHEVRVPPLAAEGEMEAPFTADRLRAYLSWWDLLAHRRIQVRALHADRAHLRATVDLREPRERQPNPLEQLTALSEVGLRRVGLHDTRVDVTTIRQTGDRQPVEMDGLEFVANLRGPQFTFRGRARRWTAAGLEARGIALAGRGDAGNITLERGRVRFHGGTVAAEGTLEVREGDVAMDLRVRQLPLGELTAQLGIPEEWDVQGNLTGSMGLSVLSGELQRLQGTLTVAPGALARQDNVFPWRSATADLDWTPQAIALRNIDVAGEGIRLRGTADVLGDPAAPLVARPFEAQGRVEATGAQGVGALARVMAFDIPVEGRWDVESGSVDFRASGTVGALQQARAAGRFQANGFLVRPGERSAPLLIRTIEGDLERSPERLRVLRVRATTEGLVARGNLTVTPERQDRPGAFTADGQVDLESLATLRRQLPDATFWQWIEPATAASTGRITFRASGPTADPRQASGTGGFRFQEFAAAVPVGREPWRVPIREITGRLSFRENRLAISAVDLRSDLFRGSANVVIHDATGAASPTGTFRVVSSRWAELPPARGRVPAGLSGGVLTLDARIPETPLAGEPAAGPQPLQGRLELRGASYRAAFAGQERRVALQVAAADFRVRDGRVDLPGYRLVTPLFRTSGAGNARQQADQQWLVRADGILVTADAGELARWWTGSDYLDGGDLTARYTLRAPLDRPENAQVSARVRLVNAQPRLPPGALPFNAQDARIRSLTGTFTRQDSVLRFSNAVWQAPRFRAAGDGVIQNRVLDGSLRLTTSEWRGIAGDLARTLRVAGGQLTIAGRVRGEVDRLAQAPISGTITLRGARLASDRNASVPVQGGSLELHADARGTLSRLAASDLQGRFSVRNLRLAALRPRAQPAGIDLAQGRFRRTGNRIILSDLSARAPGGRLTGEGELRGVGTGQASHRFQFRTEGTELARLLPAITPVPGTAAGGRFTGSLTLRGTATTPIAFMEGRANVRDARWRPPNKQFTVPIERMTAHFVRRGTVGTLDQAGVTIPGGRANVTGSFTGLGTTAARHTINVEWRLEDASAWASRFLPIPGWFTGGVFTGEARISGSLRNPNETATGRFVLLDTGFLPPQRFLGGPVRPIDVSRASGRVRRAGGRTTIEGLTLQTSVGTASGTVVSDDRGIAAINARAEIARLQALVDLWPAFSERIRGGRGEMTIALRGPLRQPSRLAGTVDILGRDGVLTVEDVDELYAGHPFDTFRTRLALGSDGRVRFEQVRMRGPKANLDGEGLVYADGRLWGKGNAWFTADFTKKLVRPRILYPLAKLVGYKRLKSHWELHGTLQAARLDMGITDSLAWKLFIRKRVPERLRRIATGDAPIWGPGTFDRAPRVAVR